VSGGTGLPLTLAGAAAGGLAAVAVREAVVATPAFAAWVRLALEPLRRAGQEGYAPSVLERRRLALLGTLAAIVAGWFLAGLAAALPLAVAGPAIGTAAVNRRRRRYPRSPGGLWTRGGALCDEDAGGHERDGRGRERRGYGGRASPARHHGPIVPVRLHRDNCRCRAKGWCR